MVFIAGNSILLLLEIVSPFFGYWHGVSMGMTLFFSFMGGMMLNSYSTKMIQDIWLMPDGRHIEVTFFNAFWIPKTEKLRIVNLGYLAPSRLYNVESASYMQNRTLYINLHRNLYKHPEYEEIIKRIFMGQQLSFASLTGFETKTMAQTKDEMGVTGRLIKPKKKKQYH
ncbi:hypothetical protein FGO68_gene17578 [Halteria grandinella]|uniref:Uncharacterized protein n=1 Tax=Halteria grandinella TaxID=5974 RepID=A0A8J8NBM7_HALGN|nr:hypothetical protein FGO68_gene17578 [Halteria grandinella]